MGAQAARRSKRRLKRAAGKQTRHGAGNTPSRKRGRALMVRGTKAWCREIFLTTLMANNFHGIDRF